MGRPLYMHPYMNISINILDSSMNLSIRTLVIFMKPFCGNSNASFQMRDYILCLTLATKDLVIHLLQPKASTFSTRALI